MSDRPDPERLVLEDLSDDERRALLEAVDPHAALLVDRIAVALRSLDEDGWDAARTPTLRFAPDGLEEPTPFWARFCVRGDDGEHQVGAPVVALAITVAVLLAFVAGFVTRGAVSSDQARGSGGVERADDVPLRRPSSTAGDHGASLTVPLRGALGSAGPRP